MERLNITKGKAEIRKEYRCWIEIETESGKRLAETKFYGGKSCVGYEQAKANAKLYIDGHNTYNNCGILPSELLKQNQELVECLEELIKLHSSNVGVSELQIKASVLLEKHKN